MEDNVAEHIWQEIKKHAPVNSGLDVAITISRARKWSLSYVQRFREHDKLGKTLELRTFLFESFGAVEEIGISKF